MATVGNFKTTLQPDHCNSTKIQIPLRSKRISHNTKFLIIIN